MLPETDKLFETMEAHIKHYTYDQQIDINKYDPVVFSNTDFSASNNYFIFNTRIDPSVIKDVKKELIGRTDMITITNKVLYHPRLIRVVFNSTADIFFVPILYDRCLFRERPIFISDFELRDCEFM